MGKLKLPTYLTRPENIFVLVAALFGLGFVFQIQPLFGNDEIVHFPRAFHIQEGHLWNEHLQGYDYGGRVPTQLKQFNDGFREQVQSKTLDQARLHELKERYSTEKLEGSDREQLAFTSAGVYSAWSYAPPALGVLTARILNLPLNWYVYLGRIFALINYIVLVYFALKYLPFGKHFLLVVALLPTAMTQAATVGIDGMVNGLSWLTIALTLAVFSKTIRVTPKLLGLLAFLSVYLATTKQGYVPLALLPLVIPGHLYPCNYKKVWIWRLVFGGTLAAVSMWYLGATSPLADAMHNVQRPGLFVDSAAQLHYVFQHSLQFISMIFIQPFTIWSANIYAGIVGILTNRVIFLPVALILLLFMTLFMTAFHKERPHIAKRDRLFIVGSSTAALLGSFILINLALYVSFTRVGYGHVEGLQGRYFLPLLPLLGIILHVAAPKLFLKLPERFVAGIVYPVLLLGLVTTAIVV